MKKLYYIYLTKNLLENKCYVGLHSSRDENDGYVGSGYYLKNSIKKHGKDNIKDLYIKGHTTKEICNILHCGPNTITKVIKKFNLRKNG